MVNFANKEQVFKDLALSRAPDLSSRIEGRAAMPGHEAEARICNFCENLFEQNPSMLQGISKGQFTKMVLEIHEALDRSSLNSRQKLELIEKLCTRTIDSERTGINNLDTKYDPTGNIAINQQHDGKSTLENLHAIATKPLTAEIRKQGFSNAQFLTSIMQDLVDPNRVDQGITATCATTTLQWHACKYSPAMYTKHMADLITQGVCKDQSGQVLLKATTFIPQDERTLSCSFYQSCMMNSVDGGYDSKNDLVKGKIGQHGGLFSRQIETLLESSTGKAHVRIDNGNPKLLEIINENLNQQKLTTAVLSGIADGDHLWHAVNVVGMDKDYVYIRNPLPQQDLKDREGMKVIDKERHICRIDKKTFEKNTQYMVCAAENVKALGVTAGGTDEDIIHTNEKPARFFTANLDQTYAEFLKIKMINESLAKAQEDKSYAKPSNHKKHLKED